MVFPLVSIIIPTHNRKFKLIRLINSILSSTYPKEKLEIIVVDDASIDGTFETIKTKFPQDIVKVIRNQENKLVAETRNIGIKNSKGEYVFFIDDDVVLDKDTINNLIGFLQKNRNSVLAGPIIYQFGASKMIWSAGVRINFWTTYGDFLGQGQLDKGQFKDVIECDAFPTAFMIHRSLIDRVGLFNSVLFPVGFEEIDFCVRSKLLGYRPLVIPSAKVWHDRKKGVHLSNASNFYFGTRNRVIASTLWSRSYFQVIISRIFSIFYTFIFLFLKTIFYPQNYVKCVEAILKGLWAGIIISRKLEPYVLQVRKGGDIEYLSNEREIQEFNY